LRALLHAEADMKAHPQDTIAYVAKTASTDAARLAAHWQEFDNTIRLDPGIAAMLAADATYVVRDDANFVGKLIPDYGHFVDATALKAVAPDRVTLEK
jgi:ABC-type nitrate/sulfonate/bicarbonate transport system substrate-binding protein